MIFCSDLKIRNIHFQRSALALPIDGIIHSSGSSIPVVSRSHSNGSDNVSTIFIGTKERSVKLMECLIVA
uniref:Uncharacterized protein n=1 Tax=Nelumbo nucifera TaxID=4432 RepID=A0A822XXT9_NELNU|nr:TPA_asm: hypothetical protein HUJ06_027912 [Nelumbo nucifera]